MNVYGVSEYWLVIRRALSLIGKLVVTLRGYTAMGTERQELLGKGFATDFSQRAVDAHSWWSRDRTSVDLVGIGLAGG